jgi:hypothetical protein
MNVEEARRAIVAFLDQFVERGAASDVVALRDRLRDNPDAATEIASQLPGSEAAPEEVFEAMRRLFDAGPAIDSISPPNLVELHTWTTREADGETDDPAQWHDWLNVLSTLPDREPH